MYIGFTYCPDVCPTTMTKIRDAREKLGTHASRIDVAMLTIDPQRDNMQALREYVTRFVENGTALRANSIQDLDAVVRSFGASYVNKPGPTPDKPEVWHSTWHYAIDSDGQLIAQWPLETKTSDFAADLAQLLKTKAK